MAGLDAIAFTGGIGENAAGLRSACCSGLEFFGIRLDRDMNDSGLGDRVVSSPESAVRVVVLTTNEEVVVARRAYRCLTAARYSATS
jgi:acetate kinase